MPFNHEDKVGYQELAPSLRELLDKIEAEVKGRQSEYIKGNSDLIKNLQGRATKLENNDKLNSLYELTENDDEFSASGQVLKINPSTKKLYQHDEFLARRIVSNQYEKDDEMIRIPDTMEKIFTTWKRYAHFDRFSTMLLDKSNYGGMNEYPEGQNLDHRIYTVYTDPKQTGWRFNKNTNCIEATIDGVATAGFISPTADYANYYLKTMVDTGWDDDNLMIVIGYTIDNNGKEHTLSLVRGAGTFPRTLDQRNDIKNGKLDEISSFMYNGKKLYKRLLYNIPARVLPKNDGNNFIIGNPTFTYPRKKFRAAFNSIDSWNHDYTRQESEVSAEAWNNFWENEVFPKSSPYYGTVFDCTFWWGLIYDMGNDTQFIITDLSDEVGPAPFATNHRVVETATTIAYISAQRDGNYFKFTTTGWSIDGSADDILPQGTFEFSCPEEKPANWSDEMYDNIQKMCLEPSHIGFGCRSGLPRFTIVEQQGIFKDENIYSVYEDKEYKFNPRTVGWDAIGKVSENKSFTQKIFLYNPRLKTLYWYNDAFDYTKISMHPELKEFTTKGRDGQILKYNGRKDTLQYDDEFHICNVVDNDKDFETIKNTKFSLKDVFDNWDRISGCWEESTIPTTYKFQNYNNEGHIAARNAYSFDEVSQMIVNSRNSYETSAFLAKDYYDKFKIKLGLNGYDNDDDPIFMIVGFLTDEKGIQHDVSVVRCGGIDKQHETGPLFLMYDAMSYLYSGDGELTPNNIADHNSENYKMLILKGLEYSDDLRRMRWKEGEVELEIVRGKTSNGIPFIEARSCNPGEHIDYNKPRTFFRYELPRAVPEHWSAEQYLNIVNMLTSESKVGFGTQSNPCKFRIISQEGFIQDEKIYHLKRNRVYTRAQGSDWRENGTIPDHMMSKVLMYNKKTKKLFWYNTESQDKSTTDYLQLESKTKINPQNNDHDINASFIVGTFYDQTIGATIKVPTTSRKEISATIKITK